jgi:hypothetical protein
MVQFMCRSTGSDPQSTGAEHLYLEFLWLFSMHNYIVISEEQK